MTIEWLEHVIDGREDEHCEFKLAESTFNVLKLYRYCVALANEQGGCLVLGVTDQVPRSVVGTRAFSSLEKVKLDILNAIRMRVAVAEINHPDGRVLVFQVPSRPVGTPVSYEGSFWMRSGESLVAMSADQLRRIHEEASGPDFSSQIVPSSSISDLDTEAIEEFRRQWSRKTKNGAIPRMDVTQLLEDSELSVDGNLTIAALVMLGTKRALGRSMGQAEVVWEYRSADDQIEASHRHAFREGFLTFHDELWTLIGARNTVSSVREGLFRRDIPAFNEDAVREAILNAVCHRDYRLGGSVFIRQYPKRLQITSPGGLPEGITPENVIRKQHPRNRRLAEACEKCGLVERSGQGMDRIFDSSLREGKGQPDFTGTDPYEVVLTLRGEVIDPRFAALVDLAAKRDIELTAEHLVVLDEIRKGSELSPESLKLVPHLMKIGLVERKRRGKKPLLILSRGMYRYLGETGVYTRERGLSKQTYKELLKQCIADCGPHGASLEEFRQVLHTIEDRQIRSLVYELRDHGEIFLEGRTRRARWFLAKKGDV